MAQIDKTSPDFLKIIHEAIDKAVRFEVSRRFDEQKKILLEDMERQKDEVVAGIVLTLMKSVDFQTMGQTLTIRVMTK